jgi:hypothetical protein
MTTQLFVFCIQRIFVTTRLVNKSVLIWNLLYLCSFLVGEGAREWAKSKDIALPPSIEDANKVIFSIVI